jgi:Methyltransferase domain
VTKLNRFLPPRIRNALKVLLGRAAVAPFTQEANRRFACPVCQGDRVELQPVPFSLFHQLDKHEHVYSTFQYETCNLEHYSCSRCDASDRDRLYAIYFRSVRANRTEPLRVLDIAPSKPLSGYLKRLPGIEVRTADLYMDGVDDKVDITDMHGYPAEAFDVFICSHVLEHVENDILAMKELHRTLRTGGWGIAMVPIHLGLRTAHEDPSITDEAGRWKYYGQGDHVRLYAKDAFVERLQSVGFKVDQLDRRHFGDDVFERFGIHPRSVLYIVRK